MWKIVIFHIATLNNPRVNCNAIFTSLKPWKTQVNGSEIGMDHAKNLELCWKLPRFCPVDGIPIPYDFFWDLRWCRMAEPEKVCSTSRAFSSNDHTWDQITWHFMGKSSTENHWEKNLWIVDVYFMIFPLKIARLLMKIYPWNWVDVPLLIDDPIYKLTINSHCWKIDEHDPFIVDCPSMSKLLHFFSEVALVNQRIFHAKLNPSMAAGWFCSHLWWNQMVSFMINSMCDVLFVFNHEKHRVVETRKFDSLARIGLECQELNRRTTTWNCFFWLNVCLYLYADADVDVDVDVDVCIYLNIYTIQTMAI